VKPFSPLALASAAIVTAAAFAVPQGGATAVAATPPPTPPPIAAPETPQPAASLLPTPSATLIPLSLGSPRPHASATPSPPPNARKGLDGVWEVVIQRPNSTDYTHFALQQQGNSLSGTYLDSKKQKYPVVGTVDGESVRLIVSLSNGTTLLLEGKLDGTTDMVGMLTAAGEQVPFTASYRAKEKWIENVNPAPGGIGQGGGGYTPP
jgi:hypothetical protein